MIVDAIACYRLTRLVVADDLTEAPRAATVAWAYRRAGRFPVGLGAQATVHEQVAADPHPPKLAKLATCPWCASFYVGLLVVGLRRWAPRAWGPLAEALTFSALAGLLSGHEHN